jgi:hypothetical protein
MTDAPTAPSEAGTTNYGILRKMTAQTSSDKKGWLRVVLETLKIALSVSLGASVTYHVSSNQNMNITVKDSPNGSLQAVSGQISQDNSKNIFLFKEGFEAEVVKSTSSMEAPRKDHRDRILAVMERLVTALSEKNSTVQDVRTVGDAFAKVIETAPLSAYRLTGTEFSIEPGTTYFLPDGDNVIAFLGAHDPADPDTIDIRKNGRKSAMSVGSLREFSQGDEQCRLILHEVAKNFTSAAFSYICELLSPPSH